MASIRERIIAAAIALLDGDAGKPTGLVITRHRTRPAGSGESKTLDLYPIDEGISRAFNQRRGPISTRRLLLRLELRVRTVGSAIADQVLDEIATWVERVLVDQKLSDAAGGPLSNGIEATRVTWETEERDKLNALAVFDMTADYHTLARDPETRP